jgi:PAS domain-containing protein
MDEERLHEILEENRRLRQRLVDLEERQLETRSQPAFQRDKTHVTKVLKLLEQRDHTVEDIALKLDQVQAELDSATEQLRLFRLAADLATQALDPGPALVLTFSGDGKLLLHNRAAAETFGDRIRQWRFHDVEQMDFNELDPYLPIFLKQMIASGRPAVRAAERGPRKITTDGIIVGTPPHPQGAVLRITVTKA